MRHPNTRTARQRARELLEDSLECLDREQQTFGIYRLRDNLTEVMGLLYNTQHPTGSVDLQGIDDGEPAAYDIGKVTIEHTGRAGFVFKDEIDISLDVEDSD